MNAIHLPTLTVRRVSGVRGDVVHFAQVHKYADGRTEYWSSCDDVEMIPNKYHPKGFEVRCRLLSLQFKRAKEKK